MTVEQIPTDEMLDKLHDMYMEGLPTPQEDQAFDYTAVAAAWEKERNRRM